MKPILSYYTNMPTPYQLDFIEALAEHFEINVVFFTERETDRQWQLQVKEGLKFETLKTSRFIRLIQRKIVSFHFSGSILPLLIKDPAEFVLVNGTYWSPNVVLATYISRRRKKKVFYYGEPIFSSNTKVQAWLKKHLFSYVLKNYTDAIFAIGDLAIKSYQAIGYKKQIYNIPYNINTSLFKSENIDLKNKELLSRTYKASGECIVLTSGSLIERKGIDTLIEAFKKIPFSASAKLLIMGDGPQLKFLENLAKGDERICFIGFQDKEWIPVFFAIADIFAFASRYDGWGLVINEAIASETAIISSNKVGAAIDLLDDQHNAIIVNAEDVDGFSAALQKLIYDRPFRSQMVRNASQLEYKISSVYNAKLVYDICATIE